MRTLYEINVVEQPEHRSAPWRVERFVEIDTGDGGSRVDLIGTITRDGVFVFDENADDPELDSLDLAILARFTAAVCGIDRRLPEWLDQRIARMRAVLSTASA